MNLVSFTSDFGLQDNYVGVVKGVMLAINPNLRIVDLTHEITPFFVAQAAYQINAAYRFFPKGTVHLAVVDPGVGTNRLPLILRTAAYDFVGPDNGIFTGILKSEGVGCLVIRRAAVSKLCDINPESATTFDGRDLFGPAAALLAKGIRIEEIAGPMNEAPVLLPEPQIYESGRQRVAVIHIDRFGNIVTALHRSCLRSNRKLAQVNAGERSIGTISNSYQDVPAGQLLAVWGSSGYLELSVNQGNAADLLDYTPGRDLVEVVIK